MKENLKNLFDYELLRLMLLCSKRINETSTKKEVYEVWEKWIMNNKEFRQSVQTLNEEKLNGYIQRIKSLFPENLNVNETYFAFDVIKMHLKIYIRDLQKKEESKSGILEQMQKELEENNIKLTPLSFIDFMNKQDNKEYYIKNILAKGTINMIYSPPACMKSFISYYMALCLSTGNTFLNQKTKKVNIGYFDWENPISDIQNRIKGMCNGLDLDINDIDNFYFFAKQPTLLRVGNRDSYVLEDLRTQLLEFIELNDIKVLFFDTLRRLGNFDENDSRAINTIKSELFDYLISQHDVCIVFLHHTNKEGKDYRGSVDIEGILDTAYNVTKVDKEDSLTIKFKNTKRRNNELEFLKCSVEIENEEYEEDNEMYERITNVKFMQLIEEDIEDKNEYKEYKDYFIENLVIGDKYKNKDLSKCLKDNFGVSAPATHSKIIKWLVKINILKEFGEYKNKYYILNPAYSDYEESLQLKELERHFFNMFKNNELVSIKLLKDKFEEKYFSLIVDDWIKKGWLNNAKKGYLMVTDLFKSENSQEELKVEEINFDEEVI